jgi:tetratricopeptide (TPR) repeat protein
MLTEVGKESLANVPQMEEVRQDLLEKARIFYDMFQKQKPADASLRLGTALAHSRLGDIYRLQGQNENARGAYDKAIAQLTALHSKFTDGEYAFQLAVAYRQLGELLRPHDSGGAEDAYGRAGVLLEALVLRFPDSREYALELALIRNNRGILLATDTARASDAESSYLAAVAVFDRLTSLHDDPAASYRLAQTYNNLGALLRQKTDRQTDAEMFYRKAIEAMERLHRAQPNRREYKEELAKFYNNMGNFRVLRREFEFALAENQRALELFEELAAPVRGISNELANGYNSRGLILQQFSQTQGTKASRQKEAVEAYQRSIQIFADLERRFHDFSQDSDAKARYGNALANLGRLRMEAGDLEEAVRLLKLAVTQYLGALRSGAPRSDYQRNLAIIYWTLAEAHLRSGNSEGAVEAGELSTRTLPAQESYVRGARILTRAATLAQGMRNSPGGKRGELRRSYATRAISMLERAVALGYSTERLQSEATAGGAFYPLRDEPGFRKVLEMHDTGSHY